MVSQRDHYQNHYLRCRSLAEQTMSPEIRALWLSVADSYRVLVDFEESFPMLASEELAQHRMRPT